MRTEEAHQMLKLYLSEPGRELWWDCHPSFYGLTEGDGLEDSINHVVRNESLDTETQIGQLFTSVTTNPSIVADFILKENKEPVSDVNLGTGTVIQRGARVLESLHAQSNEEHGWISAQINPGYAFNSEKIIRQGKYFASLAPNVMVKVPGTEQGYEAIEELVSAGISVNGTLSYSLSQFKRFGEAVAAGRLRNESNRVVKTVVTHMAGRVFGPALSASVERRQIALSERDKRIAEAEIAIRGAKLLSEIDSQSHVLMSSLRLDTKDSSFLHMALTHRLEIYYTFKPDVLVGLMQCDFAAMKEELLSARDFETSEVFEKLRNVPSYAALLDPNGIRPENFERLPQFLETHAEVTSSIAEVTKGLNYA